MQSSARMQASSIDPNLQTERTRLELIREQSRKVKHGARLMLEHIGEVQSMPVPQDVPRKALAYVSWINHTDGDEYWRLCRILDVTPTGLTIELCDTGVERGGVSRNAVRLLLAGKPVKNKEPKRCVTCGREIKGRSARSIYCSITCNARAAKARKAGK